MSETPIRAVQQESPNGQQQGKITQETKDVRVIEGRESTVKEERTWRTTTHHVCQSSGWLRGKGVGKFVTEGRTICDRNIERGMAHAGQWLREQLLVNVLQQKRLFRTWRQAKSLRLWRGAVARCRFQRRLVEVQDSALLAQPPTCRLLGLVAALCSDLEALPPNDNAPSAAATLEAAFPA